MINELSIVLPYRFKDARRERIFSWILKRYNSLFPEAEIIVSDSDEDKPFSRSQARNYGVDSVGSKYMLMADADTMPFRPFIEAALTSLYKGSSWVLPYGVKGYFNLRHPYSDAVLAQSPDVFITPDKFEWIHQLESWAGQIVMRTESFYEVNGYDERFKGWGYEDNAFQKAMDTIVGPVERIEAGWTAHLWHPEPLDERWRHPLFEQNQQRMHHYHKCYGDRIDMCKLVEGNRL
jgi:hypothetical protein